MVLLVKYQPSHLETKIWAAVRGKQDVVIARFIVTD